MDGITLVRVHRPHLINGLAHHVQDAAENCVSHRDGDGCAGVFDRHTPDQPVGRVHADGTDGPVSQVLGNLENQVVLFIGDEGVGHEQGVIYVRQVPLWELNVYDSADDL